MTSTHPDLLAGLAHCGATGSCTAPLVLSTSGGQTVYTCSCGLRVDAVDLEEAIAVRALGRLSAPALRARLENGGHGPAASPKALATWWVDADPTQRRSMLDLIVERVTARGGRPDEPGALTITWR